MRLVRFCQGSLSWHYHVIKHHTVTCIYGVLAFLLTRLFYFSFLSSSFLILHHKSGENDLTRVRCIDFLLSFLSLIICHLTRMRVCVHIYYSHAGLSIKLFYTKKIIYEASTIGIRLSSYCNAPLILCFLLAIEFFYALSR